MIKHLLLAHFAFCTLVNNIDIQFKPDGSVVIPNVVVRGLIDPTHDALLTIAQYLGINVGSRDIDSEITGEMIAENGFRVEPGIAGIAVSPALNSRIYFGIGPGSALLNRYGSISVLKTSPNNGSLIMGDSESSFRIFCVPDSVISLPYHRMEWRFVVQMQYWLNFASGESTVHEQSNRFPSLISSSSDKMLTVPLSMADAIINIITGTGATSDTRGGFSNCSRESVIERLPVMQLRQSSSAIVLYPDDYMTFDDEGNECGFNFNIPDSRWADVTINPLRFPSVNVHITGREIFICDTWA